MKDMIQVSGLTRDYGKGRGIFDVSFSVAEGEVFGFLGPNGAGKTTTIRHLMGYLRPLSGLCRIAGLDCWRNAPQVQKTLGYIPGEMAFPDDMTGASFLDFYAGYRGMTEPMRRGELLERFELDPRGKLKKMSKGMKQKVGIVAAFMHDPGILILDEPTSGLDPLMQNRFIELVREERQRGKTILMSSHMFEEVERTCHRVGIIRKGQMAAVDTVDALKQEQVKRFEITLTDEAAATAFARHGFEAVVDGTRVIVTVRKDLQQLLKALASSPVTNLSAPHQSLEEIFLAYYGGGKK